MKEAGLNIISILSVHIYYIIIGLLLGTFKDINSMYILLDFISKYILPFLLGILLFNLIYKKRKIYDAFNKDDISVSVLITLLLVGLWCFLEYYQNGIINQAFNKIDRNIYSYIHHPAIEMQIIPYNRDMIIYFLMAYIGFSVYKYIYLALQNKKQQQ